MAVHRMDSSIWRHLPVDVAETIMKLVLDHVPETNEMPRAPGAKPPHVFMTLPSGLMA